MPCPYTVRSREERRPHGLRRDHARILERGLRNAALSPIGPTWYNFRSRDSRTGLAMWTKRTLILLPIAVWVFLLQSYFWVPTYEQQARVTPNRLSQYITASIGDAETLNPILHADTASGGICGMVFEGLIDRDRDLSWRGRLATRWKIFEEAYLVVNPKDKRTPEQIAELIRSEKARRKGENSKLAGCLANITRVEIQPAETLKHTVEEEVPEEKGQEGDKKKTKTVEVKLTVRRPPRIKLTLRINDIKHLEELVEKISEIEEILSVERR